MYQQDIRKIAIVRRNGFGDFICAVPLIMHLEKTYPDAVITLFVDERNHSIVPYFFTHLKTVVIPAGNKYLSLLRVGLTYRAKKFDLVISVKSSPMKLNNLFLAVLGGKHNLAIVDEKSWHSKFINHPRNADLYKIGHQALQCLRIFDPAIQHISSDLYPKISLDRLTPLSVSLPSPYLLVSVSNNRISSTLSSTSLASIANDIYKKHDISLIISCHKKDKKQAKELQHALNMPSQIFITPDLNSFLSVLNLADIVLVGDGGICHFAASMNKNLVALYAGTSLEKWGPLSEQAICLFDTNNVNNIPEIEIKKAVEPFLISSPSNKAVLP
ncbi:glycosyltransferase family 9 protein [Pragia fontium]|uniref:glycosyltransferase family 9 protein n=1 Tax=Pragia fontium TaxID=82985 RepID=UPI00064A3864|nr:glycosyltransferase family 9 protein [Pragia fontium]AKJ41987.1 hypothetical protein QQ39_07735 [Pragia fontium]